MITMIFNQTDHSRSLWRFPAFNGKQAVRIQIEKSSSKKYMHSGNVYSTCTLFGVRIGLTGSRILGATNHSKITQYCIWLTVLTVYCSKTQRFINHACKFHLLIINFRDFIIIIFVGGFLERLPYPVDGRKCDRSEQAKEKKKMSILTYNPLRYAPNQRVIHVSRI
jgi:hypothetical protein